MCVMNGTLPSNGGTSHGSNGLARPGGGRGTRFAGRIATDTHFATHATTGPRGHAAQERGGTTPTRCRRTAFVAA